MIHRWPDVRKILQNGVGPGESVVVESPQLLSKSDLYGIGCCDCRTQTLLEHLDDELQIVKQEPCLSQVWGCQEETAADISRDNRKVEARLMHVFPDGSIYTGDWQDKLRSGCGIQVWQDGARYEGEWHKGTAHGKGMFLHANGDVYEGGWMQDQAHGFGSYTHKNGSLYKGNWSHDLQDGRGVETWSDGTRYEGDYVGGFKHGVGKLSWSDGSVYKGRFQQNSIHGHGVYSWADGRRYVGQWQNNRMHGRGQFSWADGRSYAGEYTDDVKDGIGMFQCADGRVFAGRWSNGELAVGGKDVAVDADEREPHPDGRVKNSHLSDINSHVPALNEVHQLQDRSLSPGWLAALDQLTTVTRENLHLALRATREAGTHCGSGAPMTKQSPLQLDPEHDGTFPALSELAQSTRISTRLRGDTHEVVRVDTLKPASTVTVQHGPSFGEHANHKLCNPQPEFPGQNSV